MAATPDLAKDYSTDSEQPHGLAFIIRIVRQHLLLLLLGLVLGLIISALKYIRGTPIYEASSQVLVIHKRPAAMEGAIALSQFEDYVSTHEAFLRSPVVVAEAIKKWNLQSLPSFANVADPTNTIISSTTVSHDKNSEGGSSVILFLSFRGPVAEDCPKVLNALIDSYREFLDKNYQNVNNDNLKLITQKVEELQEKLTEKERKYREFRERAPQIETDKEGVRLRHDRSPAIEAKRSTLFIRRAEIQARLAALAKAQSEGVANEVLAEMIANWRRKERLDLAANGRASVNPERLEEQLFPLIAEEQNLLAFYGPDASQVQAIHKRIELTRQFYAGAAIPGYGRISSSPKTEPQSQNPVAAYRQSLQQELSEIDVDDQELARLYDMESSGLKELTAFEAAVEPLRSDIARTLHFHDNLLKQLEGVGLAKDFGGYSAQIISPPGSGWKVAPQAFRTFVTGGILGLLGGFALGYAYDLSDRSFRSPQDVRRRLGLPVVGHVPFLQESEPPLEASADETILPQTIYAYHKPKSVEAEAYRGIRTALYFSTGGEHHKLVQITSPDPGDGKSTLAANLAVSVAQSGKKTLLIDADFRKPVQHTMFRMQGGPGLAAVIEGEAELADAVHPSGVPGLWLLPCGPRPFNPAELLTVPRFKELLDVLREQYDFVLVDTPPLLVVTDPAVVAPRVDGVLLVIRPSKHGRPKAERAKEILAGLGAKILGVVVNGVGQHAGYGEYTYGSYRYGYGSYSHDGDYVASKDYYAKDSTNGQESEDSNHANAGPAAGGDKVRPLNGDGKKGMGGHGNKAGGGNAYRRIIRWVVGKRG